MDREPDGVPMITSSIDQASEAARGENGSVLVLVAVWMPVLILFVMFVLEIGNWYEHKRHLQTQVDAGALAGGSQFNLCPAEWLAGGTAGSTTIGGTARQYAGDPGTANPYNLQIGGSNQGAMTILLNSKLYALGAPPAPDDTVEQPPCQAEMLDVKGTEAGLPLFLPNFVPGLSSVRQINARARVELRAIAGGKGTLPIAVPDVNPTAAVATFVDDSTGVELSGCTDATTGVALPKCTVPLVKQGFANGVSAWDSSASVASVPISAAKVGVRIALAGRPLCNPAASPACGSTVSAAAAAPMCDPTNAAATLVDCYDETGSPSHISLVGIRGWSSSPSGAQPAAPQARSVRLIQGAGCTDPYFVSDKQPCPAVQVEAHIDMGSLASTDARITVAGPAVCPTTGQNTGCPLNFVSGDLWRSADISLSGASGVVPYTLNWAERSGTTGLGSCNTNNNNPCKGTFSPSPMRQTYFASDALSGPLKLVQAWNYDVPTSPTFWADSFQSNASPNKHNLVVKIGVTGNLQNASSVNDPIVSLRVIGNRNQTLDCDPNLTTLADELAQGCGPQYVVNDGSTNCTATSQTALWNSPQPWMCVAIDTGGRTNNPAQGLNTRILGAPKPGSCPAPGQPGHNNWSLFPNLLPNDPRIVEVFLTPFGSFSGSGGNFTVSVNEFAFFYITGWTGKGSGFDNPCQGNGDDPVPNSAKNGQPDPGVIVGHFIKYVAAMNTGGGGPQLCDPNSFGGCVPVLTK
jgi:hypothetical protein